MRWAREYFEKLVRRRSAQVVRVSVSHCRAKCGVIHVLTVRIDDEGFLHMVDPEPTRRKIFYTCPARGVETSVDELLPSGAISVVSIGTPRAPRGGRRDG